VAGFRIDVAAGKANDRELRDNPLTIAHDHPVTAHSGSDRSSIWTVRKSAIFCGAGGR
jgi:hypothetical protein